MRGHDFFAFVEWAGGYESVSSIGCIAYLESALVSLIGIVNFFLKAVVVGVGGGGGGNKSSLCSCGWMHYTNFFCYTGESRQS